MSRTPRSCAWTLPTCYGRQVNSKQQRILSGANARSDTMCFTLGWLVSFAIWLIIVIAIYKIMEILLPWLASKTDPIVAQVGKIVLWAIMCIIVLYIIVELISCL